MAKRFQQDSGEERVTAKSRPMMSLIARAPSTLSSSASESPGKKSFGSQSPWSAKTEKDDRTMQPVVDRDASHESMHHHKQFVESSYLARYSGWDDDKAWSSQEWKADKSMDDRRGNPLSLLGQGRTSSNHVSLMRRLSTLFWKKKKNLMIERSNPLSALKEEPRAQQFIIEDDEAELELSLGSRSFLDRVNDQVRKRQKRSSMNVTEDMSVTMESAVFMGKNLISAFHQEYERSHVRHICKIGVRTRLGTLFIEVFVFDW